MQEVGHQQQALQAAHGAVAEGEGIYQSGSQASSSLTPHPGLLPLKGRRNYVGQHRGRLDSFGVKRSYRSSLTLLILLNMNTTEHARNSISSPTCGRGPRLHGCRRQGTNSRRFRRRVEQLPRVRVYQSGSQATSLLTPHPGLLPFKGRRNYVRQTGLIRRETGSSIDV